MADIKGKVTVTLTPDEVKQAILFYLEHNSGLRATPSDVKFKVNRGYDGDFREPSTPPSLEHAKIELGLGEIKHLSNMGTLHYPPGVRGGHSTKAG